MMFVNNVIQLIKLGFDIFSMSFLYCLQFLFVQFWKMKHNLFKYFYIIFKIFEWNVFFNFRFSFRFSDMFYQFDKSSKKLLTPFVMAQIKICNWTEKFGSAHLVNFMIKFIWKWVQIEDQLKFRNTIR